MTSVLSKPVSPSPTQTIQRIKGQADEKPRGRQRNRSQLHPVEVDDESGDGGDGNSSDGEGPSRKRRRSRKGLDKKFECPHDGCGKSYSRAEHLYRHQLNHTPKQIYNCDFPDCHRMFVRQDLCTRHKERHTAKGSQLQRKDSMLHTVPHMNRIHQGMGAGSGVTLEVDRSPCAPKPSLNDHYQYNSPIDNLPSPFSPSTIQSGTSASFLPSTSSTGTDYSDYSYQSGFKRSHSDHSMPPSNGLLSRPELAHARDSQRHSSFGVLEARSMDSIPTRAQQQTAVGSYGLPSSLPSQLANDGSQATGKHSSGVSPYIDQQKFASFSLPPPGFQSTAPTTPSIRTEASQVPSPHKDGMALNYEHQDDVLSSTSGPDMMLMDQMAVPNTIPVFGGEGYNRSPFAIPDDFVAYLFSAQQFNGSGMNGLGQQNFIDYIDAQNQYQPYYTNDAALGGFYPPQNAQHPMAVESLLDTSLPETVLSDEKSQEIIDLIKERFNETDHAPVAKQKVALMEGDRNDDSHMMSRTMMQTYIGSFWWHFHPQLPILHKPTFNPDRTPNLLLVAIMAIGASCLDKCHGFKVTTAGAELSNFLAWHLRWEIFSDVHFRPPAKLWVFQTLLLLEIYEKMYSTRALHERAHIHHATTITLMRRGSSLIGRSSSASGANTPDEWWNHWITSEATRRAAFAAFVIDSTHATMFGHSTVMVAHEMRLPLPCEEALWSATNSSEVGRMEANLHANGSKPISFLEGLKRTLNAQEVRTSSFGRTILMSGLLSVSWHMNQRDLQVNSLGVSQALGGRDKWRGSLTRAFDLWKQDFDRFLNDDADTRTIGPYTSGGAQDENVVYESRTVLHHLAHMAMHVDVVDCQIFARAKRLLGRTIGSQDLNSAQRRMRDVWAPSAKARDATYYALRFLCSALLPEDSQFNTQSYERKNDQTVFYYSARDDNLLNRPWVLYFAALVVWSYGYALEGPSNASIASSNSAAQVEDMRAYLRRFGSVRSPEELKGLRGFNQCTGLLMVLAETFQKTRWELLHEAANLLTNCINLVGGHVT